MNLFQRPFMVLNDYWVSVERSFGDNGSTYKTDWEPWSTN